MIYVIYFFLIPDRNSITAYSGRLFAAGLQRRGYPVKLVYEDREKETLLSSLRQGAIVFQKCLHPLHQAERIKHLKGKVGLIHIDDDWMDMDNQAHLETLRLTDRVLVASREHQQAMSAYTDAPCFVIRALPDAENYPYIPFAERQNDPLIIAWQQSCADGYVSDLLTIAGPLRALRRKLNFRLRLYGWRLGIGYPDRRAAAREALPFAEFIPYVPLDEYWTKIVPEIGRSDLFVVPYVDSPTRRGKGGFGMKRLMMLGVPVVAAGFGVHREIITDGVNGYLADTAEEWQLKIKRLLTDPELRRKFSVNGRKLMEEEYGYDCCLDLFIAALGPFLPPGGGKPGA